MNSLLDAKHCLEVSETDTLETDMELLLCGIGYALIAIAQELQKANERKAIPLPPDPDCTCGSDEPPGPAHREGCPDRIPF